MSVSENLYRLAECLYTQLFPIPKKEADQYLGYSLQPALSERERERESSGQVVDAFLLANDNFLSRTAAAVIINIIAGTVELGGSSLMSLAEKEGRHEHQVNAEADIYLYQ